RVWDAATGRAVQAFGPLKRDDQTSPYALFAPDGLRVISGSAGGLAILWEIGSGREIRRFQIPEATGVVDKMIIKGNRLVAACHYSEHGTYRTSACLWDLDSGRQMVHWPALLSEEIVGFSPNDEKLMTVKDGKPGTLWDAATGKMIRDYNHLTAD